MNLLQHVHELLNATPADLPPQRFTAGQLIELRSYDGKARDEVGEVYAAEWKEGACDWLYSVRCFNAEGEALKFRNFWGRKLEAE